MNALTPAIEAALLGTPVVPQPKPKTPATRLHIRMEEANRPALAAALAEVQRKKAQNDHTVQDLMNIADLAEGFLDTLGLPKRARRGATYSYADAGAEASSYRYPMASTMAVFRRDVRGWFLADLYRMKQFPKAPTISDAYLTEEQADLLPAKFKGYRRLRNKESGPFKMSVR